MVAGDDEVVVSKLSKKVKLPTPISVARALMRASHRAEETTNFCEFLLCTTALNS
jgi:hypothetical protein